MLDTICEDLAIRHSKTRPTHAWIFGFVELLQGTIPHEHWCIVFRRRTFHRLSPLHASHNSSSTATTRIRLGIPYQGQTPSALFLGLPVWKIEVSAPFRH